MSELLVRDLTDDAVNDSVVGQSGTGEAWKKRSTKY